MDEGKRISSSRTYTISTFYETKVSCIGRKFREYFLNEPKKDQFFSVSFKNIRCCLGLTTFLFH